MKVWSELDISTIEWRHCVVRLVQHFNTSAHTTWDAGDIEYQMLH